VLTCGRKLNGEVFQFAKYHNSTEIFLHHRCIIKENLLMQPSLVNPGAMGQMEGFTHQASFIYFNEQASIKSLCDELHELLLSYPGISFGVTQAHPHALLIRLLGYKAAQLFDCMKTVAQFIQSPKPVAHAT
jgi:urease accessory protein